MARCEKWAALLAAALCLTACAGTPESSGPSAQAGTGTAAGGLRLPGGGSQENGRTEADAQFAEVVQAAAPVSERIMASWNGEEPVTLEDRTALLDAVASLGVPVTVFQPLRGWGIRGYEPLQAFCADAAAGKEGETACYEVMLDGVTQYRFTARDGRITVASRIWKCGENAPRDEWSNTEVFDDIVLWDNGWMVWSRDAGDEMSDSMGVRIVPLSDKVIGLYEKYVQGLDWAQDHVLTQTWDVSDTQTIRWEYLYGALLWAEGKQLNGGALGEGGGSEGPFLIPAADVEERLTAHFPVTAEELRALPNYRPETQEYSFGYFPGSGAFMTGAVEVTDVTDHPDGSFTLQLEWVDDRMLEELRGRYFLTVMPEGGDSWRYLGNRVDETAGDIAKLQASEA